MNKRIGIIGYGSQGKAVAMNLHDSGYEITIGLPAKSKSRKNASKDFKVYTVANCVKNSDIICFAFPDHLHGKVYEKSIKKNLNKNNCLWFLHGLSIHFGLIKPIKDCDIIMIAPHAPGLAVREKYLDDRSLSAFYAVHQNYTKNASKLVFELAKAVGFIRKNLVKTSFEHEAIGDLFGEQVVLCGGLTSLIMAGFETLVKKGIPPENAYLEVAFQLDLIVELIKKFGIKGMYERISLAARFGSSLSAPIIIDQSAKDRIEKIYDEISSGNFASRLSNLDKKNIKRLNKSLKSLSNQEFEKAVSKFRKD